MLSAQLGLLLCVCLVHMTVLDAGAAQYRIMSSVGLPETGAVVEIGSERGEGSTLYLSDTARGVGRPFYTVDFHPSMYLGARLICGTCAHHMRGEEFVENVLPKKLSSPHSCVAFSYLDNFDWTFEADINESWMRPQVEAYAQFGTTDEQRRHTNKNSQTAHLLQAQGVHKWSCQRSVVLFDDTWPTQQGWDGKGGTAVPWLLETGQWSVLNSSAVGFDKGGFVVLRMTSGGLTTAVPNRVLDVGSSKQLILSDYGPVYTQEYSAGLGLTCPLCASLVALARPGRFGVVIGEYSTSVSPHLHFLSNSVGYGTSPSKDSASQIRTQDYEMVQRKSSGEIVAVVYGQDGLEAAFASAGASAAGAPNVLVVPDFAENGLDGCRRLNGGEFDQLDFVVFADSQNVAPVLESGFDMIGRTRPALVVPNEESATAAVAAASGVQIGYGCFRAPRGQHDKSPAVACVPTDSAKLVAAVDGWEPLD